MWWTAGLWGWLAGGALLVGALAGWFLRLPVRLLAGVMAFGSGVLLSALSFDLMDHAQKHGGLWATAGGFLFGAAVFAGVDHLLSRRGARHRKRSGGQQPSEDEHEGSGAAIAVGALLDGIPESIVIGTSMLAGKGVSLVAVAAIFLSNLPEGLSSSAGMKKAGRSALYVFGLWSAIAFVSGLASVVGFVAFRGVAPELVSAVTATAAGAILAMLIDTMIPEAFEESHALAGFIAVAGFLAAFALSKTAEPSDEDCGGTAAAIDRGRSFVMSDNRQIAHGRDRKRIAMHEDYEVRYWTQKFGVSKDELQRAADAVGSSAEKVGDSLKHHKH